MEMGLVREQSHITPMSAAGYEYLLVAQPDATVYAQVMAEKQFFYHQFGATIAVRTKPHITVANFRAFEAMEETIIRWMGRVISTKQCFDVSIDRYTAFRPHTICLRVNEQQPFLDLAKELKVVDQYIQGYGCPGMKMVSNAHMTIARRLDLNTYQQAVKTYADRSFNAAFRIKELILLRRRDEFDTCRQVNVFGLRP